jgi:hypothetical protein
MMFSTNPTNWNPQIEAGRQVTRTETNCKPHPEFADLKQFSNWIDAQLELLEKRYVDFETHDSLQRHFQR